MNIFQYVRKNKSCKGYNGKGFFDKPDKFSCIICGEELKDKKRMTCSKKCADIYFKISKRKKNYQDHHKTKLFYANNEEAREHMGKKYAKK